MNITGKQNKLHEQRKVEKYVLLRESKVWLEYVTKKNPVLSPMFLLYSYTATTLITLPTPDGLLFFTLSNSVTPAGCPMI